MREHEKLDKSEAADEVRKQRAEQAIETLNHAHDKIEQFLKTQAPRMGKGKRTVEVKSNITDNESAKMTTSKGTIQGYNGVATVDKKRQIIVDVQVFGEGQEHQTLQTVLKSIKERFKRLAINQDILQAQTIITADTGFANETNMQYLHDNGINAYIPDNQFRSRGPKFNEQKAKYGKRHQDKTVLKKQVIPDSEFHFDSAHKSCVCPAGNTISFRGVRNNDQGIAKAFFDGKLLQCRNCDKKHQFMHNPSAADHRKGAGRQVSFRLDSNRPPNYTDWMTNSSGMNLNSFSWPRRGESQGRDE